MVFYTWGEGSLDKYDPGFGQKVEWDIPLLDGYPFQWVKNIAADPGSHHYNGIINPDMISQIMLWHPDVILVYGWAYQSHLQAMRYFKGKVPVCFRGDSTLLDNSPWISNILKTVALSWVYRHIDIAFYTGANNRSYFKKYAVKDSDLVFAPHAVDNSRFAENKSGEAALLRQKLSIGPNDTLILFAGKFEEKKNPVLLADVFLSLKLPHVHLLFVGNGLLGPVLKSKAGDSKNLHFMDFQNQSQMPAIYQACDLFCLPSRGPGESWGLAVNEAMAAGKAVLVSDKVGCAIDLVESGITGEIFSANDFNHLKKKLVGLIENKATLARCGKNAKDKIAVWSFENQVAAIVAILNKENAR
jgi:glycosyltransferase involved in cell wall biosynthesis